MSQSSIKPGATSAPLQTSNPLAPANGASTVLPSVGAAGTAKPGQAKELKNGKNPEANVGFFQSKWNQIKALPSRIIKSPGLVLYNLVLFIIKSVLRIPYVIILMVGLPLVGVFVLLQVIIKSIDNKMGFPTKPVEVAPVKKEEEKTVDLETFSFLNTQEKEEAVKLLKTGQLFKSACGCLQESQTELEKDSHQVKTQQDLLTFMTKLKRNKDEVLASCTKAKTFAAILWDHFSKSLEASGTQEPNNTVLKDLREKIAKLPQWLSAAFVTHLLDYAYHKYETDTDSFAFNALGRVFPGKSDVEVLDGFKFEKDRQLATVAKLTTLATGFEKNAKVIALLSDVRKDCDLYQSLSAEKVSDDQSLTGLLEKISLSSLNVNLVKNLADTIANYIFAAQSGTELTMDDIMPYALGKAKIFLAEQNHVRLSKLNDLVYQSLKKLYPDLQDVANKERFKQLLNTFNARTQAFKCEEVLFGVANFALVNNYNNPQMGDLLKNYLRAHKVAPDAFNSPVFSSMLLGFYENFTSMNPNIDELCSFTANLIEVLNTNLAEEHNFYLAFVDVLKFLGDKLSKEDLEKVSAIVKRHKDVLNKPFKLPEIPKPLPTSVPAPDPLAALPKEVEDKDNKMQGILAKLNKDEEKAKLELQLQAQYEQAKADAKAKDKLEEKNHDQANRLRLFKIWHGKYPTFLSAKSLEVSALGVIADMPVADNNPKVVDVVLAQVFEDKDDDSLRAYFQNQKTHDKDLYAHLFDYVNISCLKLSSQVGEEAKLNFIKAKLKQIKEDLDSLLKNKEQNLYKNEKLLAYIIAGFLSCLNNLKETDFIKEHKSDLLQEFSQIFALKKQNTREIVNYFISLDLMNDPKFSKRAEALADLQSLLKVEFKPKDNS